MGWTTIEIVPTLVQYKTRDGEAIQHISNITLCKVVDVFWISGLQVSEDEYNRVRKLIEKWIIQEE